MAVSPCPWVLLWPSPTLPGPREGGRVRLPRTETQTQLLPLPQRAPRNPLQQSPKGPCPPRLLPTLKHALEVPELAL